MTIFKSLPPEKSAAPPPTRNEERVVYDRLKICKRIDPSAVTGTTRAAQAAALK
jgi:hypothetical protein